MSAMVNFHKILKNKIKSWLLLGKSNSLHRPVISVLRKFPKSRLKVGTVIFHGCSANCSYIDLQNQKFLGTRKWFSSDAAYACDYGRQFGLANGNGVLWVCQVENFIPALIGKQSDLGSVNPWGIDFPRRFPDEFERHARCFICRGRSIALLSSPLTIGYREILISCPQHVLRVLDIIPIPSDKNLSGILGQNVNNKYLHLR